MERELQEYDSFFEKLPNETLEYIRLLHEGSRKHELMKDITFIRIKPYFLVKNYKFDVFIFLDSELTKINYPKYIKAKNYAGLYRDESLFLQKIASRCYYKNYGFGVWLNKANKYTTIEIKEEIIMTYILNLYPEMYSNKREYRLHECFAHCLRISYLIQFAKFMKEDKHNWGFLGDEITNNLTISGYKHKENDVFTRKREDKIPTNIENENKLARLIYSKLGLIAKKYIFWKAMEDFKREEFNERENEILKDIEYPNYEELSCYEYEIELRKRMSVFSSKISMHILRYEVNMWICEPNDFSFVEL